MRDDQGIRKNVTTGFDPGLDIRITSEPLGFRYGAGVVGPEPECRRLDDIRRSLLDPNCSGPDPVYAIVMDVARQVDRAELARRMLLFGIVTYAAGRLGQEPVRSQGHVHRVSSHSGWSPPELYEIWSGRAIVYMQEFAADDPGPCYAVEAGPGDVVVVPPGWAHCAINADPEQSMTFGAWCDREYGFLYDDVRSRGGLAWYPVFEQDVPITWRHNFRYHRCKLFLQRARAYPELGLSRNLPIYSQFAQSPDTMQWVSKPALVEQVWKAFVPGVAWQ